MSSVLNKNRRLDNYLPVFLYSHASFAEWDEKCKTAQPKVSGEIDIEDKYTSMTSLDDYFFKVDKNMIVVDPIPHGLLCLSGIEIDTLFPLFITKKGNASFVKSKPKQFYAKINEMGKEMDIKGFMKKQINIFRQLYQNTKVYYPDDTINNLRIAFDTNDGVPWNIRIPHGTGDRRIEDHFKVIQGKWSRQYNTTRGDQCIYLNEVFKKIRSEITKLYGKNKKIMIYLVSCRKQPEYEYIFGDEPSFLNKFLDKQNGVLQKGIENTNKLRPGTITLRQTRTQLKNESAFSKDDDNPNNINRLEKLTFKAVKTRKRKRNRKALKSKKKTRKNSSISRSKSKSRSRSKSRSKSMSRSRSKSMSRSRSKSMSRSRSKGVAV